MAQMAQMPAKRSEEELKKVYEEMMERLELEADHVLKLVDLQQICHGVPDPVKDLKMKPEEFSVLEMEGAGFSFNDPDFPARKLYVLNQIWKVSQKMEKISKMSQVEIHVLREQILHLHEEIVKIEIEMHKDESPEIVKDLKRKFQHVMEIPGLQVAGAVLLGGLLAKMPQEVQIAAGFAASFLAVAQILQKMTKMTEVGEKISWQLRQVEKRMKIGSKKVEISSTKMEMHFKELIQKIQEMKIMAGAQMCSQFSSEFTHTFPGGNVIRSFMKIVEKLSYIEIRMMHMLFDDREAQRQIAQILESQTDLKKMTEQVKHTHRNTHTHTHSNTHIHTRTRTRTETHTHAHTQTHIHRRSDSPLNPVRQSA